ncbi:hypothetical protein MRX96_011383 [Rhipicephalus microplus]
MTAIFKRKWCENVGPSEGESERDGSFFSIGDVVAPHGSAGTFSECVVHDCGYSLIVCMVVVGGVNIVRSVLVCIRSLEGFHSGFPPALMQSVIHIAGDGSDLIRRTKLVRNGLATSCVVKLAGLVEA